MRFQFLLLCGLLPFCASASNTVELFFYNNTPGELIYPESPTVANQPCDFGDNTIGPNAHVWALYASISPNSFAANAQSFKISAPQFSYPSLEHCRYVVSSRPEGYASDFTLYHKTSVGYCVKNLDSAKNLYAYITSTGDIHLKKVYIITLGLTPKGETCMPY
jgi:hypothetical protein